MEFEFDLQAIWTTAGASIAVLAIGYIFGFLQSIAPFMPSTGTVRNWVLAVITGAMVILAGLTSGKTLDDPAAIGNVFSGFLVFVGLYRMALSASDAGVTTAVSTAGGEPLEVKPPDATVTG
jgi:hypothetical protein